MATAGHGSTIQGSYYFLPLNKDEDEPITALRESLQSSKQLKLQLLFSCHHIVYTINTKKKPEAAELREGREPEGASALPPLFVPGEKAPFFGNESALFSLNRSAVFAKFKCPFWSVSPHFQGASAASGRNHKDFL